MFSMSSMSPCEIQGTIRVAKPIRKLGTITDINGARWNVRGIFGGRFGNYVQAARESGLHPYFTDTSGASFGMVSQEWKPYNVEVVAQ